MDISELPVSTCLNALSIGSSLLMAGAVAEKNMPCALLFNQASGTLGYLEAANQEVANISEDLAKMESSNAAIQAWRLWKIADSVQLLLRRDGLGMARSLESASRIATPVIAIARATRPQR